MAVSRIHVGEAAEAVVDAYRTYELRERGLCEVTVTNSCYSVRHFLAWRAATGRGSIERLDVGELHDYVVVEAERLRIGAMRQKVTVLRTFARFLFATGHGERSQRLCPGSGGRPFRRVAQGGGRRHGVSASGEL